MNNTIFYVDDTTSVRQNVKLDLITLETGAGPVLETELKAISGGQEVSEIKEGEILTYQVITKNTNTLAGIIRKLRELPGVASTNTILVFSTMINRVHKV